MNKLNSIPKQNITKIITILRKLVEENKTTVKELSNLTGISELIIENTIKDNPPIELIFKDETLYSISKKYNIDMEEFFDKIEKREKKRN